MNNKGFITIVYIIVLFCVSMLLILTLQISISNLSSLKKFEQIDKMYNQLNGIDLDNMSCSTNFDYENLSEDINKFIEVEDLDKFKKDSENKNYCISEIELDDFIIFVVKKGTLIEQPEDNDLEDSYGSNNLEIDNEEEYEYNEIIDIFIYKKGSSI